VCQVITLDMGLLVAGTKYRGEFEERLKKLMEEIKQNDDIILVSPQLPMPPMLCRRGAHLPLSTLAAYSPIGKIQGWG
jgi:hypothetical protein